MKMFIFIMLSGLVVEALVSSLAFAGQVIDNDAKNYSCQVVVFDKPIKGQTRNYGVVKIQNFPETLEDLQSALVPVTTNEKTTVVESTRNPITVTFVAVDQSRGWDYIQTLENSEQVIPTWTFQYKADYSLYKEIPTTLPKVIAFDSNKGPFTIYLYPGEKKIQVHQEPYARSEDLFAFCFPDSK